MNDDIPEAETELDFFLRPVTTAEIFYAVRIYEMGPIGSYNQAIEIARTIPLSRVPFQVPEQFRDIQNVESLRGIVRNFTYVDDTNPWYAVCLKNFNDFVSCIREHINPETSLMNDRANCKGLSTLAIVLGRYLGIPSRYVQDSEDHIKFELNECGVWIPHDHEDFDRTDSIFELRDEDSFHKLPWRYQKDDDVRVSERIQFDRLYVSLLRELDKLD
jgi:hypothetical protein